MAHSRTISPSTTILVLAARHRHEKVTGRTRVQKLIYFLREKLPIAVSYTPYYYGPYSEEVAASLDSLVARNLLKVEVEPRNTEGPFEGRLYQYTLTRDGREVLEQLTREQKSDIQRIESAADHILKGSPSTATLAVASKLHYIVSQSRQPVRRAELSKRARQFGWQIAAGETGKAVQFLLDMGLVSMN